MREVPLIDRRVEKEATEIMELIAHNLRGKYVAPFEEMLNNRNNILSENPPPEIGLLAALKPFVDEQCCTVIDKLVSSYGMATLAKVMAEDLMHSKTDHDSSGLRIVNPNAKAIQGLQFSKFSIIIPLIILLIFIETH